MIYIGKTYTVEEFLALPLPDLEESRKQKEEAEDAYWDSLSDLLEEHPPGLPFTRR